LQDPIDEAARKEGVFRVVDDAREPRSRGALEPMRIFTFTSREQLAGFSQKMDAAGAKVFPEVQCREENAARSASLRDRVREAHVLEILH
jgi:hypothetical protein